jgi:hypothetical protein
LRHDSVAGYQPAVVRQNHSAVEQEQQMPRISAFRSVVVDPE